jgi:opacity protein-like surface antigen
MRICVPLVLVLFLLLPVLGFGQDTREWEFFAGYSLQHSHVREYFKSTPSIYSVKNLQENLNGWNVSVTENLNKWFGGTFDASGHYKTPVLSGSSNREQMHTFMYGPRISLHTAHIVPFGHALFGAAISSVKVQPTGPHASETSFAVAAGGGVDLNLSDSVAVRLIQADYLHADALGSSQNNYRAAAGIVFRVGKSK